MRERERATEREPDVHLADDAKEFVERSIALEPAVSAEDAEFERQMDIARTVMHDHRVVLAALAK